MISSSSLLNLTDAECSSQKVHLVLVRHGVSEHNRAYQILKKDGTISYNYKYNSNPSHPNYKPSNLLEEGKEKLAETAKKLYDSGIHAINTTAYVSPMPRTQQSAEILIQHSQESKEANDYESKEVLAVRVKKFVISLQDFLSKEKSIDIKNIVIVSHDSSLEMMVKIFDPNADAKIVPGSYLEYDLSFNPVTPNELGTLTVSKG